MNIKPIEDVVGPDGEINWDKLKGLVDTKAPSGKKKSQSKKGRLTDISDPASKVDIEQPKETVWKVVHVYMRPGETAGQVDYAARDERQTTGPRIVVVKHYHAALETCEGSKCREVL